MSASKEYYRLCRDCAQVFKARIAEHRYIEAFICPDCRPMTYSGNDIKHIIIDKTG